tara:strand:+ start:64 stop:2331 length:2268 start_codon:yes stop_codon:yes gene_type:complete
MAEQTSFTLDLPSGFLDDISKIDSKELEPIIRGMSDGSISINEYLSAAMKRLEGSLDDKEQIKKGKKRIQSLGNTLKRILNDFEKVEGNKGKYSLDTVPWKAIANSSTVQTMLSSDRTSSGTFDTIGYTENLVEAYYNTFKGRFTDVEKNYPFEKIGNEGGIARSFGNKKNNPKAYPIRGTNAFEAVPRASITIPKIVEAIQAITDPEVKAAVTIKMLVPFRNTEIWGKNEASLKVGDIDFEEGYASSFTRGKKTRPSVRFGTLALEILRDSAEKAIALKAEELGISVEDLKTKTEYASVLDNIFIFPNVNDTKVKKGLMEEGDLAGKFRENKPLMGRLIKGPSDLRKLMPSLLAKALGADAGTVSKILGHGEDINLAGNLEAMTTTFYVSEVDDPDFDPKRKAYDTLEHMVARETGATTLNELAANLNVGASRLIAEDAPAYEVPDKPTSPSRIQAEQTPEQKAAVAAKARESAARSERNIARLGFETAQFETQRIQEQEKVTPEAIVKANRDKRERDFNVQKTEIEEYKRLLELEKTGNLTEFDEFQLEQFNKKYAGKVSQTGKSYSLSGNVELDEYGFPILSDDEADKVSQSLADAGEKTQASTKKPLLKGLVAGAITLLGPGKLKAGVEIGTELAAEAFSPSPTSDETGLLSKGLFSGAGSMEDEQLLQLMQSDAQTSDLQSVSELAGTELSRRVAEKEKMLARKSHPLREGPGNINEKARRYLDKYSGPVSDYKQDLEEEYQGFAMRQLP